MIDTILWLFLWAPGLTILLELPVIYLTKTCRKIVYIIAVNGLTNLTLNLIALFLNSLVGPLLAANGYSGPDLGLVWLCLAEILLIPNAEALLYSKLSQQKNWKIWLFTYAANVLSFTAGELLAFILPI